MSGHETPRYERLFENTLVPMMLLDLQNGSILSVNDAAAEFYGYSREEMQGMPVSTIETMSPAEVMELMQRQIREMKEVRRMLKHRLADGSVREVAASVGIMPDAEGPIAYVIIFDVTAWSAALEHLDDYRERLLDTASDDEQAE